MQVLTKMTSTLDLFDICAHMLLFCFIFISCLFNNLRALFKGIKFKWNENVAGQVFDFDQFFLFQL